MFEVLIHENDTERRPEFYNLMNIIQKLCSENDPQLYCNPNLNNKKAVQAAKTQYLLNREKVRLSNRAKRTEDLLHDIEIRNIVKSIQDLQEEYDYQFNSMIADKTVPIKEDVRRCVFRTLDYENAEKLMFMLRLYNKWTTRSSEYLVDNARRDFDMDKFQRLIQAADQDKRCLLEEAQQSVAKEYEQKLMERKRLLRAYVSDLHTVVMELNGQFPLLDLLSSILTQPTMMDS